MGLLQKSIEKGKIYYFQVFGAFIAGAWTVELHENVQVFRLFLLQKFRVHSHAFLVLNIQWLVRSGMINF